MDTNSLLRKRVSPFYAGSQYSYTDPPGSRLDCRRPVGYRPPEAKWTLLQHCLTPLERNHRTCQKVRCSHAHECHPILYPSRRPKHKKSPSKSLPGIQSPVRYAKSGAGSRSVRITPRTRDLRVPNVAQQARRIQRTRRQVWNCQSY